MIDVTTKERLIVYLAENAPPYLVVPEQQLDAILKVLDANGVRYYAEDESYSIDDRPAVTFINLHRSTDPVRVQELLDGIP
jgi:hypothetical protein